MGNRLYLIGCDHNDDNGHFVILENDLGQSWIVPHLDRVTGNSRDGITEIWERFGDSTTVLDIRKYR